MVLQRCGNVTDEAGVTVIGVVVYGGETGKDVWPRGAYGEGLAEVDQQAATVMVPGVGGNVDIVGAEIWIGEDLVWIEENEA